MGSLAGSFRSVWVAASGAAGFSAAWAAKDMPLLSLGNHQLLVLWVELAALLAMARGLGSAARRLGQPPVVGELLAGLVLGPSVFGRLWPKGFGWFLPHGTASAPLLAVAALSLLFLLVVIGTETDLRLIRRKGRAAASVTIASLALPLAAGGALAAVLPAVLLGGKSGRGVFALMLAAAMAVSSLPVIAKIVSDMGLVRRDVGQLAIAAGSANDAVGFVLLALATGLVASGISHVALAMVGVVAISVLLLTVGQRVLDLLLRRARRVGPDVGASLAICVIGLLAAAAAMEAVGVEGALGAFVAGVALGRSRFRQGRALDVLNTVTSTVFSPLYFATAGLSVDVGVLGHPAVLASFAAVTAVAAGSKFLGVVLGARGARVHWREAVALGVGLNGRGALQVIIGTAGLRLGVLDTTSYTLVILMSLVTSMSVPPVLRAVIRDWQGSADEQERLGREEELDRNVVVREERVLLPSRGGPNSVAAATVLSAAWPGESEVTVLSVADGTGDGPDSPDMGAIVDALGPRRVEHRHVRSDQLLEEITAEARLGYGVIALGATDEPGARHLLSPVVDDLLIESSLPLLVVRRPSDADGNTPAPFRKLLVPVSGTVSSRAAQEVSYNLSRAWGSRVVIAHVVTRGGSSHPGIPDAAKRSRPAPSGRGPSEAAAAAQVVLRGAWALADEMGVDPDLLVLHGSSAGDEIVSAIRTTGCDAVVIGTAVRQVEGHPFLGHTVEHVLTHTNAAVVAVLLPEAADRLGTPLAGAAEPV